MQPCSYTDHKPLERMKIAVYRHVIRTRNCALLFYLILYNFDGLWPAYFNTFWHEKRLEITYGWIIMSKVRAWQCKQVNYIHKRVTKLSDCLVSIYRDLLDLHFFFCKTEFHTSYFILHFKDFRCMACKQDLYICSLSWPYSWIKMSHWTLSKSNFLNLLSKTNVLTFITYKSFIIYINLLTPPPLGVCETVMYDLCILRNWLHLCCWLTTKQTVPS